MPLSLSFLVKLCASTRKAERRRAGVRDTNGGLLLRLQHLEAGDGHRPELPVLGKDYVRKQSPTGASGGSNKNKIK